MAEAYADKMARKTDAELLEYVTGREQYREDAVLAAFDELARRGQPHPDDALARPALQAVVAEQAARAAAARQLAEPAEAAPAADAEPDPALYSPTAIAIFSILPISSMVGGGVLLAMNLFRLGRIRAMMALVLFMLVYFFVGTNLLTVAVLQLGLNPVAGMLLFNVPALLVYLFWFWPRYVAPARYRSRSILLPMLVCMLLVWGFQKLTPYLLRQQPPAVQQQMQKLLKR